MARQSEKPRDPTQMVGLQLRFRESLRAELEDAARSSGNSLNSEIVERLSRSLAQDQILGRGPTRRLLIEIAAQIERAEAMTAREWHDDPTTYWLARKLAEDVLLRSKPTPPNFEEVQEEEVVLARLRERRDVLVAFLKECRALQPANALLLGGHTGEGETPLAPSPEDRWRNSKAPDQPLSEEDRAFISDRLQELTQVQSDIELHVAVVWQLLTPWREAREKALAMHRHLAMPSGETTSES